MRTKIVEYTLWKSIKFHSASKKNFDVHEDSITFNNDSKKYNTDLMKYMTETMKYDTDSL